MRLRQYSSDLPQSGLECRADYFSVHLASAMEKSHFEPADSEPVAIYLDPLKSGPPDHFCLKFLDPFEIFIPKAIRITLHII